MASSVYTGDVTPVDEALDRLTTGFDQLLTLVDDKGLEGYDDMALIGFMQSFERLRNRMSLVDHHVIADGDRRGLPATVCQSTMVKVVASVLSVSKVEAARRVRASEALGPRTSMLADPLSPIREHLAAAQASGDVSADKVAIVEHAIAKVDRPGFDPVEVATGEQLLTDYATSFGPEDLRLLAARVVDAIDPDGTLPDDELNRDRRHFHLRSTKDGSYTGEFRLTGSAGIKLATLLDSLTAPHLAPPTDPNDAVQLYDPTNPNYAAQLYDAAQPNDTVDGRNPVDGVDVVNRASTLTGDSGGHVGEPDTRTRAQRMHDALEDLCDRLLKARDTPAVGGTPTTVIVTISLDDLLAELGYGQAADGTLIPTARVLQLATEAEIVTVVLNSSGAVLDVGRSRRIATRTQTMALIARDGGCSFPGCAHPPQYCERHHILGWADGGNTDLNNLTLLCRYHHHHFANRGWSCRIDTNGLPEWTPPSWLKPDRAPMVNTRIQMALLARRERRRRRRRRRRRPLAIARS